MEISIKRTASSRNREKYEVTINNRKIETVVTHKSDKVDSWINLTESVNWVRSPNIIVGLDIEWRPNLSPKHNRCDCDKCRNPVAIIQLCVGSRCLIFQLLYADKIPKSLVDFLGDENITFVGVGIDDDAEKLWDDYDLDVPNTVDLRRLAYKRIGRKGYQNAGLTRLAEEIVGLEYEKPRKITRSKWDKPWLLDAQVQYACVDAFLSYKIGRSLRAASP